MEEYEPDIKHIQSVLLSSPVEHLQVFNPLFRSFLSQETMKNPQTTLKSEYEFINLDLIRETRSSKAYHKRAVHIKYSPLLDPLRYMTGKFDGQPEMNKQDCFADDYPIHPTKYKDLNNASYVDSFFCFLSSKLLHGYGLQNAIDFYGSFSGIQQEFSIDIMDDYEYLSDFSEFHRKIKSGEIVCPEYSLLRQLHSIGGSNNNSRGVKQRICLEDTVLDEDVLSQIVILEKTDEEKINEKISQEEMILEYEKEPVEYEEEDTSENDDNYTEWDDDELHIELSDKDGSETEQIDDKSDRIIEKDEKIKDINEEDSEDINEEDSDEDSGDNENSDEEDSYEEDTKEENSNEDSEEEEDDGDEEEKMMATIKNFPVQLICLEKCEGTLDSVFLHEEIHSDVCMAYAFQIVATLAAYQKAYSFTHNDLHTNNIVYCSTEHQYLYYRLFGKSYRVPTFGKIIKIIDFGRSVYRFQNRKMMSDGFSPTGDAHTQYNTEPYYNPNQPRIEENPSFDLCRLGCSLYDFVLDTQENTPVEKMDPFQKMVHRWCLDDKGKSVLYKKNGQERYPHFKLYKMIARTVHQHTPENQMPDFSGFLYETGENDDETGGINWINIDQIPVLYV